MRSWNVYGIVLLSTTSGCGASTENGAAARANDPQVITIGASPRATTTNAFDTTNEVIPEVHSNHQFTAPKLRCKHTQRQDPAIGALAWISECQIKTASPIHFQFNSPVIHAESETTLQAVATLLFDDPSLRIEIGSHSDGRGSRQFNEVLTQQRADSVKASLVGKGIDPNRLVARGFGEERPISHAPEVEGRRTNRRIEFVILPE